MNTVKATQRMAHGGLAGRSVLAQPTSGRRGQGTKGRSDKASLAFRVVAASNSSARMKRNAHYVCDGVNDEEEIQAAIDDVASYLAEITKVVVLTSGLFKLGAGIVIHGNTALWGQGPSTVIEHPAQFGPTWIEASIESVSRAPLLRDLKVRAPAPNAGGVRIRRHYGVVERVTFENNELSVDAIGVAVNACRFVNARLRMTQVGYYHRGYERCFWNVDTTFVDPVILYLVDTMNMARVGVVDVTGTGEPEIVVGNVWNVLSGFAVARGKAAKVSIENFAGEQRAQCAAVGCALSTVRLDVGSTTEVAIGGAHLVGSVAIADDIGWRAGGYGAWYHNAIEQGAAIEVPQSFVSSARGPSMMAGNRITKVGLVTQINIRSISTGAVVIHNDLRSAAGTAVITDSGTGSVLSTDSNITS